MIYESEMRFTVEAENEEEAKEVIRKAEDAVEELPGTVVQGATCLEHKGPFEVQVMGSILSR